MFTKALGAFFLVIICFLAVSVRSALVGCDPFLATKPYGPYFIRDLHTTCPLSTMSWVTSESNGLEINAAMDDCPAVQDGTSAATVHFSVVPSLRNIEDNDHYILNVSSSNQYYFEYSLKWTKDNTFCVVDLTGSPMNDSNVVPINMIDQNGLSNEPTEDLKGFATNQWYTRSFTINGSSLVGLSSLRFGFTCAINVSDPTQRIQMAYVDNIKFAARDSVDVATGGFQKLLYSSAVNCTGCDNLPEVFGSSNAPNLPSIYCNESSVQWTLDGPLNITELPPLSPFVLNGDLFADAIVMSTGYGLNITGCIYPSTTGGVVSFIVGQFSSASTFYVYMNVNCTTENWNTNGNDITVVEPGWIVIGRRDPRLNCGLDDYDEDSANCVPSKPSNFNLVAVYVIVPAAVVAGVVVGIVFGVKRLRAKQRERQLEEQLNSAGLD